MCQPIVMSPDAHAPQLSAAVSSFQIGHQTLKIEDKIQSIRTKVFEKRKMFKTFGAQYENGRTEGKFLGRRVGKMYRVKWTDLNDPYELEYGACLLLFKDLSKVRPQKQLKIVGPPALAPISVGSVVAVFNDYDGLEHCPSECEVSKQNDEISGSAGYFTC
jgi:hypothetical protein